MQYRGDLNNWEEITTSGKASIEAKYHLDDPVWKQYGDYLGGVITGDLKPSYKYEGRSVNDISVMHSQFLHNLVYYH